jgi:hypothetical protein
MMMMLARIRCRNPLHAGLFTRLYGYLVWNGFGWIRPNGRFDAPVTTDAFVYYHTRTLFIFLFATCARVVCRGLIGLGDVGG